MIDGHLDQFQTHMGCDIPQLLAARPQPSAAKPQALAARPKGAEIFALGYVAVVVKKQHANICICIASHVTVKCYSQINVYIQCYSQIKSKCLFSKSTCV